MFERMFFKKGTWVPAVGRNENWFSPREIIMEDSSKSKRESPNDSATPLLVIYSREMKTVIQKDTCTSVT